MISNLGSDENGKFSGGLAGDQNGREWRIIPWYNRPWNLMLRYEGARKEEVRSLISKFGKEAAENNYIGYDQSQRLTFWNALHKYNYKPSDVKSNCEADCSSGTLAICKAVGYRLGIASLKNIDHTGYSGNIEKILNSAGFKSYKLQKYLNSDEYLKPGDILVYIGHHVAINLSTGSKVEEEHESKPVYSVGWNKNAVGWWYADTKYSYIKNKWKLINHHWYYFNSEGYIMTGLNKINGKTYYMEESGDLEGACCKTAPTGELVEWYVDQ